jgi:dimeric dUTPase (all-alpha-NTP-PPase superfamily)
MSDEPTPDRLAIMLNMQSELQERFYGQRMEDLTGEERIQKFKEMYIALVDELHEALGEMGWKAWATSKHFREPAVQGELIDAWHFFMNLLLLAHVDPEQLFQAYMAKNAKNKQRQIDGYDGVTTKCQGCGRALDDEAVECHVSTLEKYAGKHCCHDSDPFGRMIL